MFVADRFCPHLTVHRRGHRTARRRDQQRRPVRPRFQALLRFPSLIFAPCSPECRGGEHALHGSDAGLCRLPSPEPSGESSVPLREDGEDGVLRRSRQGCEFRGGGGEISLASIARIRRLAYLDHGEVRNRGVPRRKSHGCPSPEGARRWEPPGWRGNWWAWTD